MTVAELIEKLNSLPDKEIEIIIMDLNDRRPYPLERIDIHLIMHDDNSRIVLASDKAKEQAKVEGSKVSPQDKKVKIMRLIGFFSDYLALDIESIQHYNSDGLESIAKRYFDPPQVGLFIAENTFDIAKKNISLMSKRIKKSPIKEILKVIKYEN